jgi:putative methionine-R-sulfoxide reductase with GAF domain/alkylhydroperoxidase family enzyme
MRLGREETGMTADENEHAREELYRDLAIRLKALLSGETDLIANAANAAALIYHGLPDLNWAGFYLTRGAELVLGPFQGRPAVLRIPLGQGVCGTAAARGMTVRVADVHDFPGHIACDPVARSELVVPLIAEGAVIGVLDLDSPLAARFDAADQQGCENLVALFCDHHRQDPDICGVAEGAPADIDPASGCRLPLPERAALDEAGRRAYDRLTDPAGATLRGLKGPGGIQLHSPDLARHAQPLNHYLRHEAGLGARVRELAILATAREIDSAFEWAAHEPAALAAGIPRALIEVIRERKPIDAVAEADAIVIELGRQIFGRRRVTAALFARALRQFGRRKLVDLVALMGNYAGTAALLTAFAMQCDPGQPSPWPRA